MAEFVFKIKGDTTSAVSEVNKLTTAYGKFGSEVEKTESTWKKVAGMADKAAEGLAKFNLAMGGIQKIVGFAKSALDSLSDVDAFHKLRDAVPVKTFDELDAATNRLYKRSDLLRFTTKALGSDFGFTTKQMAEMLKASNVLEDRGFGPMNEIAEGLITSIAKGGKGMAEYGIILDDTKSKGEKAAEAMQKIAALAGQDDQPNEETTTVAQMNRALDDTAMTLKESLAPAIIEMVSLVSDAVQFWMDKLGGYELRVQQLKTKMAEDELEVVKATGSWLADLDRANNDWTRNNMAIVAGRMGTPGANNGVDSEMAYYTAMTAGLGEAQVGKWTHVANENKTTVPVYVVNAQEVGEHVVGGLDTADALGRLGDTRLRQLRQGATSNTTRGYGQLNYFDQPQLSNSYNNAYDFDHPNAMRSLARGETGESFHGNSDLASAADPLKKIKKDLNDSTTAAGAAFTTIQSAVTAAVDAAISGSDSIGKAAAKATSAVLKSLAIEATGRAAYEGVLALASLAIGDARGAAMHGAAAGEALIAAALMGTLAAGLGAAIGSSGGGSSSVGRGAPAGGFGPGGGIPVSGNGGGTIIVNMGNGFYGDDAKTAKAIVAALRQGERAGSRTEYASKFSGS